MRHVVLYAPQIPGNTGSIGRTCVAVGAHLHLIGPLGFSLDDRYMKRAGLDYWPYLEFSYHVGWEDFLKQEQPSQEELYFIETTAEQSFYKTPFTSQMYLIFGSEGPGLPAFLLEQYPARFFELPMFGYTRSLNLAVCCGIVLYESVRQDLF